MDPRLTGSAPFAGPGDSRPSPAVRWALTAGALATAVLSGWLLASRAVSVTANHRGVSHYEAGETAAAWPLLVEAVERSRLQSKPCVDLGNLAVWAIEDEAFRKSAGIEDPWSLARLAFLSFAEGLDRQPGNPRAWAGMAGLFEKIRSLRIGEGSIDLSVFDAGAGPLFQEEDLLVEAAYRKAVSLEPNNFFYHAYLGDHYQSRDLREKAVEAWARAVEIMPDLSWHYYLPSEEVPQDLFRALEEALERALESNPAVPRERILESMGNLARRAGRAAEAADHYRAASEAADDPSVYMYLLGDLLFNEGRYGRAEEALREAARRETLQPGTLALAHTLMGRCRLREDDTAGAQVHLERARRINPAAWYIALDLARVYEDGGLPDKAEAEYRAAIRLAPERASVYSALIDMYRRTRQISKAIPLAEKLVRMFPQNSVFKDQLDALYRELGRPEAG